MGFGFGLDIASHSKIQNSRLTHKEQRQKQIFNHREKIPKAKQTITMKLQDINLAESVVPFGGSAPAVDSPDRAILGG